MDQNPHGRRAVSFAPPRRAAAPSGSRTASSPARPPTPPAAARPSPSPSSPLLRGSCAVIVVPAEEDSRAMNRAVLLFCRIPACAKSPWSCSGFGFLVVFGFENRAKLLNMKEVPNFSTVRNSRTSS
ncbi:hypothetical protein NL676_030971 [Syzygium grande]|nr:hypothetical protein NL676_030971 [Syzygium grande]